MQRRFRSNHCKKYATPEYCRKYLKKYSQKYHRKYFYTLTVNWFLIKNEFFCGNFFRRI